MMADYESYEYWCRRGLAIGGAKSRRAQALLTINLACVSIDKGRLQEALGLSLASAAAADPASNVAVQALCAQANLYAMLGDFESAHRAIDEANSRKRSLPWKRALEFTEGYVAELQERYDDALKCYELTASDGAADEVYELRALAGIVRTAWALHRSSLAEAALERLRGCNRPGWPIARQLTREAEGFWNLLVGDTAHACDDLLAAATESSDKFWQTQLRLIVANTRGDRALFIEAIDAFDALGASSAADRARSLARSHGLRPGRKHESRGRLSEREISVALLVAGGKTNAEIGELLHVSPRTVEFHLGNILGKCGLRSRVEIAARVAAGTLLGTDAD
jgi:DNA-binding CsgD family transcriptional regulator